MLLHTHTGTASGNTLQVQNKTKQKQTNKKNHACACTQTHPHTSYTVKCAEYRIHLLKTTLYNNTWLNTDIVCTQHVFGMI